MLIVNEWVMRNVNIYGNFHYRYIYIYVHDLQRSIFFFNSSVIIMDIFQDIIY